MLTDTTILEIGGECDQLLQQFHRFDEGIGLDGKWAGGSVTGVCRGWGSTKVRIKSCVYFYNTVVVNLFLLSRISLFLLSLFMISPQRT